MVALGAFIIGGWGYSKGLRSRVVSAVILLISTAAAAVFASDDSNCRRMGRSAVSATCRVHVDVVENDRRGTLAARLQREPDCRAGNVGVDPRHVHTRVVPLVSRHQHCFCISRKQRENGKGRKGGLTEAS